MAVWNVMGNLANGPSAGAVGRVELRVGEAFHGGAEIRGSAGYFANQARAFSGRQRVDAVKFSDGETEISFHSGTPLVVSSRC
jgi:hypothetical protein